MRDRSEVLKRRRSILLVGTILIAAVPFSGARAAEQATPAVSAPAPEWPKWYFYGGVGGGGAVVSTPPGAGAGQGAAASHVRHAGNDAEPRQVRGIRRGPSRRVPGLDQSADRDDRRPLCRRLLGPQRRPQ